MRTYRLLNNAKINATVNDLEAFISRYFWQPKYGVTVRRDKLASAEFSLLFRFGDLGKYWGYAKIIDKGDETTSILGMFLYDDYFDEEEPKYLQAFYSQFEWLEELSDAIREVFDVEEEKGISQSQIANQLYLLEKENFKSEKPKQKGRYRLTPDEIKRRKKIVKEAERIFKSSDPKKTWKQIANELDIPERTLRDWRHNPQY